MVISSYFANWSCRFFFCDERASQISLFLGINMPYSLKKLPEKRMNRFFLLLLHSFGFLVRNAGSLLAALSQEWRQALRIEKET